MNETPRDGNWIDEWGSCKVCGGEIPHGHTNKCDIGKLEQELNEARLGYEALLQNYNADTISLVASERDQLRKVADELANELFLCRLTMTHSTGVLQFLNSTPNSPTS